jgi:tetratricopeptide (TPR) repeat protein
MSTALTSAMWGRVSAVLDELFDRPESEWPRLVDQRCAVDVDLRRQVMRLLTAHRRAAGFLAEPALAFVPSFAEGVDIVDIDDEQDNEPAPPKTVGPWQILREIGRGGMGVVYLAERSGEQFRQLAALKLVRPSGGSEELLARFRRERQILASLNHPSIARLLDGGRAGDGSPYLAMEYVEGQPLATYCRQRGLGLDERLRLVVKICDAVQHAHARLVVHRDLKPSNILITEAGEPRLLDFGIAKLLAETDTDTSITRRGLALMTPAYAAPEQLRGETVSTATDVYALGVILYELLTGRQCFPNGKRQATGDEAGDAEPTRPSLAVKDKPLRRRLAGDLDTIVMMSLRQDPARRYASVEALARDIERHLAGLPVSARPDTVAYRARKFVRRHRWGVAVSATAVLVLVAVAVTMAEQARRIARQRDRAERVSHFLVELFAVSSPLGEGGSVTAREILDRGAQRIERELTAEPEVQGDLMDTMGRVYWEIGLLGKAEQLFTRAVQVRSQVYGVDDVRTLRSKSGLGNILVREGRFADGVRILSETVDGERRGLGANHTDTLQTMNDLAFWLGVIGRYTEAEQLHREVLRARRQRHGTEHGDTVWSMTDLGLILMRQGRFDEAEALMTEALAIWGRIKQPGNTDRFNEALFRGNLAGVYQRQGRYGEAESYFVEALADIERVMGAENPHTLSAMKDLAAFYCVTGRYDESEKLQAKTLEISRRVLGARNAETLQSAYWLAVVYREQGRLRESDALQVETLALQREELGSDHPDTLLSIGNAARVLGRQGALAEAEKLLRQTLEAQRQKFGPQHPDTAESLYGLACVAALDGRRGAALDILRQAVESGHIDHARLAREPDLRSLHGQPEFERILTSARRPINSPRTARSIPH